MEADGGHGELLQLARLQANANSKQADFESRKRARLTEDFNSDQGGVGARGVGVGRGPGFTAFCGLQQRPGRGFEGPGLGRGGGGKGPGGGGGCWGAGERGADRGRGLEPRGRGRGQGIKGREVRAGSRGRGAGAGVA